MTPGVVPMIAPDGSTGDIPNEKANDAIRAGFKPAVVMTSPDGKMGYIPRERAADALKAGFKVGQPETSVEKNDGTSRFADPIAENGAASRGANFVRGGVSSITAPLLHPIETIEGMGKGTVAGGFTPYGTPITAPTGNEQIDKQNEQIHREAQQQAIDAGAKEMKDHPAHLTGQMVGPLLLGEAIKSPAIRAGAREVAAPLTNVADAAKESAKPAASALAERMYGSALKPSTTLEAWQRKSAIQTGLNSEIPVSENGLNKLNSLMSDLNQKISDVVAKDPTKTVNKYRVASRLGDPAERFSNQVAPTGDLNTIAQVGNDFLDTKPNNIPVVDAQKIKQGTYQTVGGRAYGEVKAAQVEAEKALARGLKEELETQFPEIKGLNQQESKMLGLEPSLQRALGRNSNHQILGIGTPIAAGAASAVTGSSTLGAIVGTLKAIVDNPMVKSKLAIAINKASKGSVSIPEAQARVRNYANSLAGAAGNINQNDANPQ